MRHLLFLLIGFTLLSATSASSSDSQPPDPNRRVVTGVVYDGATGEPIPRVTLQVTGTGRSSVANEQGQFRMVLHEGESELRFSHIAYYSESIRVAEGAAAPLEVRLKTCLIDVGGFKVYTRKLDPGQQIIMEAIRRKQDILTRINDFRYDAYTKLVLYDETKEEGPEILFITETQTTAYWEQPNRYKEVITSRKQSVNIDANENLVSVGEILNFNKNRLEIGRYKIVSPTAKDALDHYNYYLLDTVYIDSTPVFRLEIEPKDPRQPLFTGFLHIADSTYDVIQVEVGFSEGVELPFLINPTYAQKFARFEDRFWMPIQITFDLGVKLDVPFPGIPDSMRLIHQASLHNYVFDAGHDRGTFDEFTLVVDEAADNYDSTTWYQRQTIPLTSEELNGYHRLDSLKNRPLTVGRAATTFLGAGVLLALGGAEDIFHFNRVEGAYLGLGGEISTLLPRTALRLKGGYAFGMDRSEWQGGVSCTLSPKQRLRFDFDYKNNVAKRENIYVPTSYNSTFFAAMAQFDPFDYYAQKGFEFGLSSKVINHVSAGVRYSDYEHSSLPITDTFSVFDANYIRPNLPVIAGDFRAVALGLLIDSRKLILNKGESLTEDTYDYFTLHLKGEVADPGLIENDFDYLRYSANLHFSHRFERLGLASLDIYAGSSQGDLPPQRYHTVDLGDYLGWASRGFFTLGDDHFAGDRAVGITLNHEFRRRLFQATGIPGIRDVPLWLSFHGGAFWSEFSGQEPPDFIRTASRPYTEIGFAVGNLTPFISPFNLSLSFNWQLSEYDTNDFSLMFGIDL